MEKVVITTTSFGEHDDAPLKICRESGFDVVTNPYRRKIAVDELVSLAADAVGLVAGTEALSRDVLCRLRKLRVISRCGAGLENVDLVASNEMGIRVFNTPDVPTQAVAELTIGLMIDLLRMVSRMDAATKAGTWNKLMGNLLAHKKVGIIGYGRIGRRVATLLKVFTGDIGFFDPHLDESCPEAGRFEKQELLRWADIVTVHAASRDVILGDAEFRLMRPGTWLVNVSRGEVVDEHSLCEHLKSGHLGGAALDVFRQEPYHGPLKDLENVIVTPHIGSYAKESRIQMEKEAVNNLIRGLKEGVSGI